MIFSSSKNIIGKVLSPAKERFNKKNESKKPVLMTRRELCDPFGSDDEEENQIPDNKLANGVVEKPELGEADNNKTQESGDIPIPNSVSIKTFLYVIISKHKAFLS